MIYNFTSASRPTTFVLEIIEGGVVKRHFLPACYLAANGGTLSGRGIVVAPERVIDRTLPVFNILNTDKVYINGVSGGGISETIQQLNAITYRAPNSGGIKVGPHLTFEDGVLDYLLPTASATTKGGIKVGPTLWIDPDTAILNIVMAQKYDPADPDYDPENPPPLGGVIVGDGLSIDERGILSNDNPTDYFRPIQELAGIEFDFVRVVDDLSTVTWYTPSDPPTIEDHEPLSNNVPVVGKVAIYNKADVTEDPETGEKSGARVYAYEDGAPMVDEEGNDIIAGGDMIPGGGDELEDGDYVYVRHVDNPDDPDDKSGGLRAYYLLGVNEEFCDWEELGADLTYYATKVWTEWYVKDPTINIITRIDDDSSVQDEVNADDGVRELYSEALHDNGFSHGHFTLNQPEDEDTYDIYVPIPRAKDEELGLVRVEETRAATDTRGQIYLDPSTAEISVYKATAGGLLGVVKVTDTRLDTDIVGQINLSTDGTISVPIANNTLLGVVKVPAFATSHLEISSAGAVSVPIARNTVVGVVSVDIFDNSRLNLNTTTGALSVPIATNSQVGVVKVDTFADSNLNLDTTTGAVSVPIAGNTTLGVVKVDTFADSNLNLDTTTGAVSVPIAGNTTLGVVKVDTFDTSRLTLDTTTGDLSVPLAGNTTVGVVSVDTFANSRLNLDTLTGELSVPIAGNTTLGVVQVDTFANSRLNLNTTTGAVSVPLAGNTTVGVVSVDTFANSRLNLNTTTGAVSVPIAGNTSLGVVSVDTFANSRLNLNTTTGAVSVPIATNTALGVVKVPAYSTSKLNLNASGEISVNLATKSNLATPYYGVMQAGSSLKVDPAGVVGLAVDESISNTATVINDKLFVYGGESRVLVALSYRGDDTESTLISIDGGVTWEIASLPAAGRWHHVEHGDGKFVAVAESLSILAVCIDGDTQWTSVPLKDASGASISGFFMEIRYFNGTWVLVNYNGAIWVSTNDLQFFTNITNNIVGPSGFPAPGTLHWRSVCYGLKTMVGVCNGQWAFYKDDTSATATAVQLPSSAMWIFFAYGTGVFVCVGQNTNKAIWSSDRGRTWAESTLPGSANWKWTAYGGGKFVAVAQGQNRAAYGTPTYGSSGQVNGITWAWSNPITYEGTAPSSNTWQCVAYSVGKFIAISQSSCYVTYSSDGGQNWSAAKLANSSTAVTSIEWASFAVGNLNTLPYQYDSVATTSSLGIVQIGSNINVTSGGIISVPTATATTLGVVKVPSTSNLIITADGTLSVPAATTSVLGVVKVGTNIDVSSGTISVKTATASDLGVVKVQAFATSNLNLISGDLSVPIATTTSLGVVKVGDGIEVDSNGELSVPDLTFTQDTDDIAEIDAVSALAVGDVVRRIQFKQVNSDYPGSLGGTSLNFSFGSSGGTCAIRYNSGSGGGIEYTSTESGVTETQVIQFSSSGRTYTTDFEFRGGALWNAETHTLTFGEPRILTAKGTGTNGPGLTADAPWYSFEIITATNSVTYNLNTIFELLGNYYDKFETDAVFKSLLELQTGAVATTSSLGIVQIGSNINVTSGGIISVPTATATTLGVVKVPSTSNLTLSAGDLNVPIATASVLGVVKVAARATSNLSLAADGFLSAPVATASDLGVVKVGTNIDVSSGTISVKTATASDLGVVKVGTNIDVSSGTISVKTATASDLGVVKVGSNISVSSGTISVPVADATTLGVVKVQAFATSNLNLISGDLSVPKATTTSLGVVKVGDGLEVDSNGEISWAEEEYADDVAALAASQTYPHRLCWVAEVQ